VLGNEQDMHQVSASTVGWYDGKLHQMVEKHLQRSLHRTRGMGHKITHLPPGLQGIHYRFDPSYPSV
jgi:hypothetical protein